jgi:hypothetical protein
MNSEKEPITNKQKLLNLTLVGIVSQVGCVTLVIIIAALLLGLYIDSRFNTKPWFTIGLIVVSIPVSLVLMIVIVRAAMKKMKLETTLKTKQEEKKLGE